MQALWPTLVLFSECFITETTGCRCFWKFLLSHCTDLSIYMQKDPDSQNKVDLFRKNRKKGFPLQKQDSNFLRSPASPVPQTIRSIRHTVIFLRFPSASISRARRNIRRIQRIQNARTHARTHATPLAHGETSRDEIKRGRRIGPQRDLTSRRSR